MTRKVSDFAVELADREAIRDCLIRFSRALDRVDMAVSADLYWPEGTDNHGGLFHGKFDEFLPFAEQLLAKMDVTQHFLTNMLIEIDGDRANVETYIVAYHELVRDGQKKLHIGGSRYLDTLEKRDDEWRVLHRKLVIDWMKNLPDNMDWAVDVIGGHYINGGRKPVDPSMEHFKHIGK